MNNELVGAMTGHSVRSRFWAAVLCGVAGVALSIPAMAKDQPAAGQPGNVDIYATVNAVREVPLGNPMPGLHFAVKVKGNVMDVYVAPMEFVNKFGITISKGDEVRIVGKQIRAGDADVILANEITTGSFDNKNAFFRADMTYYLRNEDGPFWTEDPAAIPIKAH